MRDRNLILALDNSQPKIARYMKKEQPDGQRLSDCSLLARLRSLLITFILAAAL